MTNPLVSVICLCYNQEKFVREAIDSVAHQSYPNIELIIVDDGSTDQSVSVIRDALKKNPLVQFVSFAENLGNCRAFNQAFALSRGEFIIDFAADDVMLPERIADQVIFFSTLDPSYGVTFTDAIYIDENGKVLREHYEYLFRKKLIKAIPEGDIYHNLLSTYFISSPTMMIRREVLETLKGYDESLTYEDFDFWIRSSRLFKYGFLNKKLTKVRKISRSMSTGWYKRGDQQLYSTYLVCKKAFALNRSQKDFDALAKRLKYELRQSVFSENHKEAELFFNLLKEIKRDRMTDRILVRINKLKLPLSFLRNWYHQLRYE